MPTAYARALMRRDAMRVGGQVLYTIPTGQNPSGATFSLERRHAVYALAVKYDLIVMEDDPYYFLVRARAHMHLLSCRARNTAGTLLTPRAAVVAVLRR